MSVIALDATNFLASDATGAVSGYSFQNTQISCTQSGIFHTGWAWSLSQLPNGLIASTGEDGPVLIFDKNLRLFTRLDLAAPMRAVVASNDDTLYAADANGQIYQLRLQGGMLVETQRWQAHTSAVRCLTVDACGQLWSGAEDNQLRVWQVSAKVKPGLAAEYTLAGFVSDVLVTSNAAWVASYAGHLSIAIQ